MPSDFTDALKARILAVELAAWESARHIERAPRQADDGEKEEPPASPPPAQG